MATEQAACTVGAIARDGIDSTGAKILTVYAKYPPKYAVYRTNERVVLQYADDPDVEKTQRASIAALNPLRSCINALIDGWRQSKNEAISAKAARFDRLVADGLIMACEGDVESAQGTLEAVKDQITRERTSRATFEYLIVSAVTTLVVVLAVAAALGPLAQVFPIGADNDARRLSIAIAAGSLGAFFSIALSIRDRTVLPDLFRLNNYSDAVLRVVIGVIGAGLLMCLLRSNLATFSLGGQSISPDPAAATVKPLWILLVIIGFVAGFSERLVPDLLKNATLVASGAAGAGKSAPKPSETASDSGADVVAPAAPAPGAAASPRSADGAVQPAQDPEAIDGCACGVALTRQQATDDSDLPAAQGGIALT